MQQILEDFLADAPVKNFAREEVIVSQGIETEKTYVVKSGIVRCYDIASDGSEQLIWLIAEGEIFPLPHLLNLEHTSRLFYGAFSDVEAYSVPNKQFMNVFKSNMDLLLELCLEITRKFNDLHFRVNASSKPKAREKILHTLAFIADRFKSSRPNPGEVELSLPLTHQDIANLVGLTRETTTLTLNQLKAEKFIFYDQKHFIVRRDFIEKVLWG